MGIDRTESSHDHGCDQSMSMNFKQLSANIRIWRVVPERTFDGHRGDIYSNDRALNRGDIGGRESPTAITDRFAAQ